MQILSDENKRAQYDRFGHNASQQGFGGGSKDLEGQDFSGFGGFEDIFGSFFVRCKKRSNAPRQGDLQYSMTLSFEEAVFGTEKMYSS